MNTMSEFASNEQYKSLIQHLLTSLFVDIDEDEHENITNQVFEKLNVLESCKQFILTNYKGPIDNLKVVDSALQFILIVENILLVKEVTKNGKV